MNIRSQIVIFGMAFGVLLFPQQSLGVEYEQELHYVGLYCDKVQADSILYPANEIFVVADVFGHESGFHQTVKIPVNRTTYNNVRDGTLINDNAKLWSGRPESLTVAVLMVERDDGAKTARDVARGLYLGVKIGQAALSRGKTPSGAGSTDGDAWVPHVQEIVGAGNDLIGKDVINVISRPNTSEWSRDAVTTFRHARGGSIQYHFRSTHREGGADCWAAFRWKRGRELSTQSSSHAKSDHFEPRGKENYHCEFGGSVFELFRDDSLVNTKNGYVEGMRYSSRDPDCFFELDIATGRYRNKTLCVGDRGRLFMESSRGREIGQCWSCGTSPC